MNKLIYHICRLEKIKKDNPRFFSLDEVKSNEISNTINFENDSFNCLHQLLMFILNHNLNMKKEFYLQWVKQWNIDLINLPADNP
jgi:hypothetical protein